MVNFGFERCSWHSVTINGRKIPIMHHYLKLSKSQVVACWLATNSQGVSHTLLLRAKCRYCKIAIATLDKHGIGYIAITRKKIKKGSCREFQLDDSANAMQISNPIAAIQSLLGSILLSEWHDAKGVDRDCLDESAMSAIQAMLKSLGQQSLEHNYLRALGSKLHDCSLIDGYRFVPYIIDSSGHLQNGSETLRLKF